MSHLSDIEIAQAKELKHVITIAHKIGVDEDDIEMYGKYKAKLPLHLLDVKFSTNQRTLSLFHPFSISYNIHQQTHLSLPL